MTSQAIDTNEAAVLAIPAVAKKLDCSRGHVYGLIAAGELRATDISVGKRPKTRVPAEDVDNFIERRTRQTRERIT